jgi:glycosyltransferase involved in cell wall biosynthesis
MDVPPTRGPGFPEPVGDDAPVRRSAHDDRPPSAAPGLTVAIIIPVRNGEDTIEASVRSCLAQEEPAHDVVIIDDGSTDRTAEIAAGLGARVVGLDASRGPGGARNAGIRTTDADVLLFVDADVVAPPALTRQVRERLEADTSLTGIIGAYTPDTPAKGLITHYKNLQHHHVHRMNAGDVSTFWCGCGALRRKAFNEAGGFREARPEAVLEDVELGYRITENGGRILLDPDVRATHLKRYTLGEILRSDLFRRAIPWTRTLLTRHEKRRDLNVKTGGVLGAFFAPLTTCAALAGLFWWPAWLIGAVALVAVIALDAPFLAFLRRNKGVGFAVVGVGLQFLYHHVCALGFALGVAGHVLGKATPAKRD